MLKSFKEWVASGKPLTPSQRAVARTIDDERVA